MAQHKLPIEILIEQLPSDGKIVQIPRKTRRRKTPNGNGNAQEYIQEAKKYIQLGQRAEMTVSLTGMVEYYDLAIENLIYAYSFVDAFMLAIDKGFNGGYFEEPKQRPNLERAITIARDTKKPNDIYVAGILFYTANKKYDELAELLVQAYIRTCDGIVKKAA